MIQTSVRGQRNTLPGRLSGAVGGWRRHWPVRLGILAVLGWSTSLSAQSAWVYTFNGGTTPSNVLIGGLFPVASYGFPPQAVESDSLSEFNFATAAGAASAGNLAVRVRASLAGNSAALGDLTGYDVTNAIPSPGSDPGILPLVQIIGAYAGYKDITTANADASAQLNGYFARSFDLTVGSDPGARQAYLEKAALDPDFPLQGTIRLSQVEMSTQFLFAITNWGTLEGDLNDFQFPTVQPTDDPEYSGIVLVTSAISTIQMADYSINNGVIAIDDVYTNTFTANSTIGFSLLNGVLSQSGEVSSFEFDGSVSLADNFSLPFEFSSGFQYLFTMYATCDIAIYGLASFDAGTSANCDASRSGYWNGLTNVRGPDGNPSAQFALADSTGFDLRSASPLSPAPAVDGGVVPEPAAWAMMILGFGLVGLAARHRRRSGPVRAAA